MTTVMPLKGKVPEERRIKATVRERSDFKK